MHEIRKLRNEIAQLIGDEDCALRHEMHADIRQLRKEVVEIRQSLRAFAPDNGSLR